MELLQDRATFEFGIYADGTHAGNPGVYNDHTNSIGYWIEKGFDLTDGKVVKSEVKRIVQTYEGANLDQQFLSLENDDIKKMTAKQILFDLKKTTVNPTYLDNDEYEEARLYRQQVSAEARANRWTAMITALANPSVLANTGKVAFISEELKKFKDDYVIADNKILEAFINDQDHALNTLTGYAREGLLGFSSIGKGLSTLTLWDDPVLGGPDQAYKDIVIGVITDNIVTGKNYIQ